MTLSNATVKADQPPYTKTINGHEIAFTDYGFAHDGPAVVTFSGWNSDHRQWSFITEQLMTKYRVISVCFRDHGFNRSTVDDYGFEEHADDVLTLLGELGVDKFICVAASHGNWAAMRVAEKAGPQRMPAIVVLSHVMSEPPAPFFAAMQALQGKDTWRPATIAFFKSWLASTSNPNINSLYLTAIGGFGYETWARSGRTVSAAYKEWGSPLKRLEALQNPPLVHHIYGQPGDEAYEQLHKDFQQKHPEFFSYVKSTGQTHFPHVEQPEVVSKEIEEILQKVLAN